MSTYIERPTTIYTAVGVLWIWLGVLTLTSIYNDVTGLPKMHEMIQTAITSMGGLPASGLEGTSGFDLNTISPGLEKLIFWMQAGFDVLTIASFAGLIYEIGKGRKWARFTLLLSLLMDLGVIAFSQPETFFEWITSILNLVLESYALWLLYSANATKWFNRPKGN